MNSLHSIPKEISRDRFGLSDDQIKMIRAYKRLFDGGVAIWVNYAGKVVDVGWDNRDGHEPGVQIGFVPWRTTNWLEIFERENNDYPEFDPTWIIETIYVA